jgi:hypothetical protein
MEEEKRASYRWVSILGILLQAGSLIAVFVLAVICMRKGYKDFLFYDAEKRILLPPKQFSDACICIFWVGFAGGVMVLGYESLQKAHPITKAIRTILAAAGFVVTLFGNAFLASSMYVNEGLGFQPKYEVYDSEVNTGEEAILIVHHKIWQTVQVYYLAYYLDRDRAYWIDGYDAKGPARTYSVEENPGAVFREERLILIWDEDPEDVRHVPFNLMSFPLELDY